MVEGAVLRDAQPVAISAGIELHRAAGRAGNRGRPRTPDLLHLTQRRTPHRAGFRGIAGWPGGEERTYVPAEIVDRREHPAHGAEGAVGQRWFFLPFVVFPPVTMRDPVAGHCSWLECRRLHAERPQDRLRDVVAVWLAGDVGDDAAQNRESVVRVL